jgi:hypothetical protein
MRREEVRVEFECAFEVANGILGTARLMRHEAVAMEEARFGRERIEMTRGLECDPFRDVAQLCRFDRSCARRGPSSSGSAIAGTTGTVGSSVGEPSWSRRPVLRSWAL